MPLSPYAQQPSTPKSSSPSPRLPGSERSRRASASSTWSSSPESAGTHATTPSYSPSKHYGPCLLPQIRAQDQGLEPEPDARAFRRTKSHEPEPLPTPAYVYQPEYQRSTTSPPEFSTEPTPVSASSNDPFFTSGRQSPVAYAQLNRRDLGHGRSASSSSIEAAALRRACPPTYRSMPIYVTQQSPQYTPAVMPGLEDFVSVPLPSAPHPLYRELTPELLVETGAEPTTTMSKYLTEPNPAVNLVPHHHRGYGDGNPKHCWWDIRNLRNWDDFNVKTVTEFEILSGLLNVPVNSAALHKPATLSTTGSNPQDLSCLAQTVQDFHVAKVNAALRTAQGADRHIAMKLARSAQDGPHFVSNFANDSEASMSGNGRGRVVGLVKPYEQWNSGKRNTEKRDDKCQAGVEYLRHLAHLQVVMRAHNCRYGFIITEIELVCVRLGTEEGAPNFGLLEMSNPIPMKTNHRGDGPPSQMTACMALWYLHMLAGDSPLPGQCGWKIDVGPPAAWTRSKVLKEGLKGRDEWMPKVTQAEVRHACTLRGWAWPEDKVHRAKEGVNPGRGGRR